MQLFSQTESGEWIKAADADRESTYRCPECNGKQRLRGGQRRQRHFYHVGERKFCRQRGKGALHLQMQHHLATLLPGAQLEVPIGNRIADLFWKGTVFEIQCSPIRPGEIHARNVDYLEAGHRIVWLLSWRRFRKRRPIPLSFRTHYFFNEKLHIFDQKHNLVDLRCPLEVEGDADQLPLEQQVRLQAGELCFSGDPLSHIQPRRLSLRRPLAHAFNALFVQLLEMTHR